jgi:hypothetical protein
MNRFCRSARSDLSDRLDGAPVPFGRRLLGAFHLSLCPSCKRVRRSLLAARQALFALKDSDPSK